MSIRNETSGFPLGWARSHWKDLLCVLVLILLGVAARVESLDRVNLNPDEAQYEAMTSYMVGKELAGFEISNTSGGTGIVWVTTARLFGPYSIFEIRVLVLLLSLAMALLLYFLVSAESTEWCGLAAGLVFTHFNLFFEGLTVNREWFSIFFLLLGVAFYWLWDRRPRGGWWLVFCAGVLTALALWFKMQAGLLMFPVPLLLAWRALAGDEPKRSLSGLVVFGAGGLAASALYLAPFLSAGALAGHLEEIFTDFSDYAMGNVTVLGSESGWGPRLYLHNLYWSRPFRPLLFSAWALSLIGLAFMALRAARRRTAGLPLFERRLVLLFVLQFLGSLATISLGERFFEHYYLFFVFPVAGLAGLAIHAWSASTGPARALRWMAAIWLLLWTVDRFFVLRPYPARIGELWPASLIIVLYVLIGAGILLFGLLRPRARLPLAVAALICLEVGLVSVQGQVQETPRNLPHHRPGFETLVDHLDRTGRPGDRLFVWGWLPEIYSLSRLEAASQFGTCQYIVNDTLPVQPEPRLNEEAAATLMSDLRERRPRFIVDASRRSWTMLDSRDPWIYDLRLYPEFELVELLETEYELVGSFDGCRVYVRR